MLSQGRVKPNSASRHSTSSAPLGNSGSTGSAGSTPHKGICVEPVVLASTRQQQQSNGTLDSDVNHSAANHLHIRELPLPHSGAGSSGPHRTGRSNSSLAVAHQEFSAASTVSNGFPSRGLSNLGAHHHAAATSQANTTSIAQSGTGRKGVAPMNARPVPVSAPSPSLPSGGAPSPHHHLPTAIPHSAESSSGPVLSNTARFHQTSAPGPSRTQPPEAGSPNSVPHNTSARGHPQPPLAPGTIRDDKSQSSSANSSENSPTAQPLPASTSFPKGPPLDLSAKGNQLNGSPRQSGSHRFSLVEQESDSSNDDFSGQHVQQRRTSSKDSPTAATHTAGTESTPSLEKSDPAASSVTSSRSGGALNHRGNSKRPLAATPTPPNGSSTPSSSHGSAVPSTTGTSNSHSRHGNKAQVESTGTKASGVKEASPTKAPQIDIGPACQSLSLYDAFSFDTTLKMWVVRDDVLAKCLEYIRIMGYQHPACNKSLAAEKKLKEPSIWCPSATIATPIVAAQQSPSTNASLAPTIGGGIAASSRAVGVASPTVPAAPKLEDKLAPPTSGPQWKLIPLPAKEKSDSDLESQPENTEPPVSPLFFECDESLRWLAEQEYVIGTILLTCSFEPMSTTEKRAKLKQRQNPHDKNTETPHDGVTDGGSPQKLLRRQYVPAHTHPIRYVAAHVIHNFSHWGDFKSFSAVWDAQVRIVLGVAAPSHQKIISIPETGLLFSSEFECGNIARVQRHVQGAYNNPFVQGGICPPGTTTNVYLLWIEGDTMSDKRLWFRFCVSGCKEREPLCIRMMNIAPNARLYRNGMKPVWRAGASQQQWIPVDDYTFHLMNDERDGELSFFIAPKSSHEVIHVAFCVPYSYGDLLCHITQWHALVKRSACNIRFEERVLCRTLDERKLHLLIITSQTEKIVGKQANTQVDSRGRPVQHAGATPYSSFASGKKVVLISGRVHPGEVTASHAVHGIVSFLLSHDPRAATLREHFIFFIVPMLNPDGVARGHSRLDQNGLNLNRCYNDPNPATQPTVHSLRNVFDHLQTNFRDRFFMYLDFHSHASQQSGFAFGNHLPNSVQHWNMLFPKLISIHSNDLFDFDTCRFSRGHMVSKDGTSRVLFGGSLIHSYTIELTHFSDFKTFGDRIPNETIGATSPLVTPPVVNSGGSSAKTSAKQTPNAAPPTPPAAPAPAAVPVLQSPVINGVISQSAEVGRACVLALLDYCSIGDPSPELQKFGGMDRAVREVKREIRGGGPQRPSSYSSQSVFKQY